MSSSAGQFAQIFIPDYFFPSDDGRFILVFHLHSVPGQREPIAENDPVGFQTSACGTGNFHLKGYAGTTADDHTKHLYNMHLMLEPVIDLISQPVNAIAKEDLLQNSEILLDNYPNPFNNSTVIRFRLPERTRVRVTIFNQLGQQVELLEDRVRSQGEHKITWDTGNLPSGVYYYSLSFVNKRITRRCLLVK